MIYQSDFGDRRMLFRRRRVLPPAASIILITLIVEFVMFVLWTQF